MEIQHNMTLIYNIYLRHTNLQERRCEEKGQKRKKKKNINQSKTIVEKENSQSCNSGSFKVEDGGENLGSIDN